MSLFFRGVLLVTTLVLAGCTGFKTTKEDQTRSLQEFSETKFSAPLLMSELNLGNITVDISDPEMFLKRSSFWIYTSDAAEDMVSFERNIASDGEEMGATSMTTMHQGSGVAITEDGYIVTAAHVVKQPHILIVYGEYLVGGPVLRCSRTRIVFSDEKTDFALLKCDLTTRQRLQIRPTTVPLGIVLYSGGWANQTGAGQLLKYQEARSDTGLLYRMLHSTIPMLPGDSGSAVIDASGQLIGVTTSSVRGRFWKLEEKSRAVMLDPTELQRLIEQDRAKQR